MPNHITNKLFVEGDPEKVAVLFDSVFGEDEDGDVYMDFNRIVSMPEVLINTTSPPTDRDYADPESALIMRRMMMDKFGADNWYDWAVQNWGTKWNSYDNDFVNDSTVFFKTAWCGVPELMRIFSKAHPKVKLYYSYYDEDIGNNVGEFEFQNGEVIMGNYVESCSDEAYQIIFDINPKLKEDMVRINGTWTWAD